METKKVVIVGYLPYHLPYHPPPFNLEYQHNCKGNPQKLNYLKLLGKYKNGN